MRRPRTNISIPKEDRIWDLRCQGYDYDSIARITNVSLSSPGKVIRRVRRRPPFELDPIKRGRKIGFLSDSQIAEIRYRRSIGHTLEQIAKDYDLHFTSISKIANMQSYRKPCDDGTSSGYPFSFSNRLTRAA